MFASCRTVTVFFGETVHLSLDMGNADALFECLILLSACGMNWTGKLSWQSTLFHYNVSLASLASNYAGA